MHVKKLSRKLMCLTSSCIWATVTIDAQNTLDNVYQLTIIIIDSFNDIFCFLSITNNDFKILI